MFDDLKWKKNSLSVGLISDIGIHAELYKLL